MTMFIASIIILAMCYSLLKKYETRLVLISGGLALGCLAGDPLTAMDAFSTSMMQSNVFEVIVACMGFASVINLTGCHLHLLAVFVKLLKRAGPFLILGAALTAMIVNSAIPSSAGTAAAVGTILIPLLIAAKVPTPLAAATIMLGLWGGNLNPGHVHPTIVSNLAHRTSMDFVTSAAFPIVGSVVCASLVMILLTFYMKKKDIGMGGAVSVDEGGIPKDFKANYFFAVLPLLPLILLLLGNLNVVPCLKMPVSHAMIIGAVVVMIATRTNPQEVTKNFFKGMGNSFGDIFGIIIGANIFVAGMKSCGLIQTLIDCMSASPSIAKVASIFGPLIIAVLSGSGEAAAIAFNNAVTAHAPQFGLDIMNMGVMTVLSGAIGRSLSPVCGAMVICAGIAKVSPITVSRWIFLPLLAALTFIVCTVYVL